jgi:hypothetical protein
MNRGNRFPRWALDLFALSLSLLLVLAFLLPIGAGWWGVFLDDEAQANYPDQLFKARWLQRGCFPLWNPATYAGAHPFYTLQENYLFYPPSWISCRLASLLPSFRSFRELVLVPVILHFLWAALGAFLLGRAIGLSRPGSSATALAFALSSSMLTGILNHPMSLGLSWHPWFLWAVAFFARRPGPGRLAWGALLLALGSTVYLNYTAFGLISAGAAGTALVVRRLAREGLRPALRLAAALAAMAALSLIIAAPFWLASRDAAGMVAATFTVDYDFLTAGPRSLPWRWLATYFVPELFGSTNFALRWGAADDHTMYWCEAVSSRGLLLWFLALAAFLPLLLRRPRLAGAAPSSGSAAGGTAAWTVIGLVLLLVGLGMMLGRFSPLFGLLYRVPLLRLPYATRWHTVAALGLSLLIGIGSHRLWKIGEGEGRSLRRLATVYLVFAALAAAAAVALPPGYTSRMADRGWFLRVPVLYWLVASAALFIAVRLPPRRAGKIVVCLGLACALRNACWETYRPMGITWAPEQRQSRGPEESGLYRFMAEAARRDDSPRLRTGYSRIFADNTALVYGGLSFFGVGNKPMIPRMFRVLSAVAAGMPNEVHLPDPTLPLVRNLSGGWWWHEGREPPAADWEHAATSPDGDFHLFRIPGALPRVFTLDRLHPAGEDDQLHDLIRRDLREAAVIDQDDVELAEKLAGRRGPVAAEKVAGHFAELQERNRIARADFSIPNAVEVEIAVSAPSLLVVTDAWHPDWRATDNGKAARIHRVNYLQRGVWLEEGRHLVRMEFRPACVFAGRWLTLAGLVGFAALVFLARRRPPSAARPS